MQLDRTATNAATALQKSNPAVSLWLQDVTRAVYKRFLVDTPLRHVIPKSDRLICPLHGASHRMLHYCSLIFFSAFSLCAPTLQVPGGKDGTLPCGYGTFHARYRVNKQLIAVSVVDVLPRCLSSKYFFWDTDLGKLSLGKFSALFEAYWVKASALFVSVEVMFCV